MNPLAGLILAVVGFVGLGTPPGDDDFEARRGRAYELLVNELEDYAEWCRGRKIHKTRMGVLETILELEPDNTMALQGLGYRKRGKEWIPPKKPKKTKDYDKEALKEAPTRRREALAPFLTEMFTLFEQEGLREDQRKVVVADILRFDPDNERVRESSGEVKSEEGWVLPETEKGREQRAALAELVKQAFATAPKAEDLPPKAQDPHLGIPFRSAVQTPLVRILSTGPPGEARRLASALHAVQTIFAQVTGSDAKLGKTCTVYLLNEEDKEPFLENHPAIQGDYLEFMKKLDGSGIQGTDDFAFWKGDFQRKADGLCRIAFGWLLTGGFHIQVDQGWIYEGLGLYLTRATVRTRLNWFAQPSSELDPEKEFALRQKLLDPETNWAQETYTLLKGRTTDLSQLFSKGTIELRTEDVLLSYVLVTFLFEARPELVGPILTELGAKKPAGEVLERHLGMTLTDFTLHLERWLSERR